VTNYPKNNQFTSVSCGFQIELAFSYDVNWIRDREVITDVFILDLIFCNMVHVDSDEKRRERARRSWDQFSQ
jgi:hypothetical protein